MSKPSKKPKPIGNGNYSPCKKCRGTGWSYDLRAAKISGRKYHGQAFAGNVCKECKGAGWVDAER